MRKRSVFSMPLHIVRRSMANELSLVWIQGEYPAAFQVFRPRSKDGKWKGATTFESDSEAIDAVHSYVARRFGKDRNGLRFLTIDGACMSPFPFSPADVKWAGEVMAQHVASPGLVPPTDAGLARRILLHQSKRAKLCRTQPQTQLPAMNNGRSQ